MQSWRWPKLDDRNTPVDALTRALNNRLSKLVDVVQNIISALQTTQTLTNGGATPSVYGGSMWKAANTAPTNITGFSDGVAGQRITVWATTANTTIVNGANLRTKSGANIVMTATETREFATIDGTEWREV